MAVPLHVPMTDVARDALIATAVLWVAFAIVVFLRLLGRFQGAGVGADDVLSLLALILASTTIGFSAAVFVAGVGVDFDPSTDVYEKLLANMPYIMQITFAFTLLYIFTLAALKMSQLCLYMRVFSLQLRNWIFAGYAIVGTWALVFTFVFIFLCTPVSQQWSLDRTGRCMDQILVLKSLIMTNILTDVFIFALPIRSVWQLQMRKTEKLAVIACFALGAACVVIGIVRFWQIFVIDLIGNLTGTSITTFMLCSIELMLAGLCVNIPMLRPFYQRWRAKHRLTETSQSGRQTPFKSTRSNPLSEGHSGQRHHTAWIELDDKDTETGHDDDSGSERKLTMNQPDVIHVSKNWTVASSKHVPS